jgi:hypothetical protein
LISRIGCFVRPFQAILSLFLETLVWPVGKVGTCVHLRLHQSHSLRIEGRFTDAVFVGCPIVDISPIFSDYQTLGPTLPTSRCGMIVIMSRPFLQSQKLVEMGFSRVDHRSVRIKLTGKGGEVRDIVDAVFRKHVRTVEQVGGITPTNARPSADRCTDLNVLDRSHPLSLVRNATFQGKPPRFDSLAGGRRRRSRDKALPSACGHGLRRAPSGFAPSRERHSSSGEFIA